MIIKYVPNIFERDIREEFEIEWQAGSVGDLFDRMVESEKLNVEKDNFTCIVNGGGAKWDFKYAETDDIIFINDITGKSSSLILGVVMVVVGAVLTYATWGTASPLLAAGIGMIAGGVGSVVGSVFAPSTPTVPASMAQSMGAWADSATYTWDGIKNVIGEGQMMPFVVGRHRVGGAIIEGFIDGDVEDGIQTKSYLNMMAAVEGEIEEIETDTIQLNNKDIDLFDNVEHWTRIGTTSQAPIDNFSNISKYYRIAGVQLEYDTPYIYKTYNEIDSAKLSITIPQMYESNGDGSIDALNCDFKIEYAAYSETPSYTELTGSTSTDQEVWVDTDNVIVSSGLGDVVRTRYTLTDNVTFVAGRDYFLKVVWTYEYKFRRNSSVPWQYTTRTETDQVLIVNPATTTDVTTNVVNLQENIFGKYQSADIVGSLASVGHYRQIFRIRAKSKTRKDLLVRLNFPTKDQYLIRVTRMTEEFTAIGATGDSYFTAITEIENAVCRYPNRALLGLRILATNKISGAMPDMTFVCKGLKFRDVRTLATAPAYTTNPANILYGILTDTRFGLNRFFENRIHMVHMEDFADWCDEEVTYQEWNSSTGAYDTLTEKRYEFHAVFDTPMTALDVINQICGTCRALPYWIGDKLGIVIDRTSTPVQLFSMGNIVEDSYEEVFSKLNDVPNIVDVEFWDENNDWKRTPISAVDEDRIDDPAVSKKLAFIGMTKKSRVIREAKFAIKKAKSASSILKFETGLMGVVTQAGDVFYFQHETPQYGYGGRLTARTASSVTLDRDVPVVAGTRYRIRILKSNNTTVYYDFIASSTGDISVLNLDSVPDCTGDESYAFGEIELEAKPYRALSVTRSEESKVAIAAEPYNSSAYEDDDSVSIRETNYSALGLIEEYTVDGTATDPIPVKTADNEIGIDIYHTIPPFVDQVELTEIVRSENGQVISDILIDWENVELDARSLCHMSHYDVMRSTDASVWEVVATVGAEEDSAFVYKNAELNILHYFVVKPYTDVNRTNNVEHNDTYNTNWSITPEGAVTTPNDVEGFLVVQNGEAISMRWNAVTNAPLKHYEVRVGSWDFGDTIGTTVTERLEIPATASGTFTYGVKAVNIADIESESVAEYTITLIIAENRNIIFTQDNHALGWPGIKKDVAVSGGNLVMSNNIFEALYVGEIISLTHDTWSHNTIIYDYSATAGYLDPWEDSTFTWDSAINTWATAMSKENVMVQNEISTFQALADPFIDIYRLNESTTSEDGDTPTVENNITYGDGTYHKGVACSSSMSLEYAIDALPTNWSILFRFTIEPCKTLVSGNIIRFDDASNTIEVNLDSAGKYQLTDGTNYIELTQAMTEGDDLLIGIGNNDVSGEIEFFVDNLTQMLTDSGSSSSLTFTKPTGFKILPAGSWDNYNGTNPTWDSLTGVLWDDVQDTVIDGVLSDIAIKNIKVSDHTYEALASTSAPAGFSDWEKFIDGDYQYKEAIFRVLIASQDYEVADATLTAHKITCDVVDIIDKDTTAIGAAITQIDFTKTFYTEPTVVINSYSTADFAIAEVVSVTKTYFTARLKKIDNSNVAGSINWQAQGY